VYRATQRSPDVPQPKRNEFEWLSSERLLHGATGFEFGLEDGEVEPFRAGDEGDYDLDELIDMARAIFAETIGRKS
jgi:hypothetical protein